MNLMKPSLKDQVYNIIKEKILTLELPLGAKINIAALSQELEISNTPIREALSRLETDGLVTTEPNVGVSVTNIGMDKFIELSETTYILLIGSYENCLLLKKIDRLIQLMEERLARQRDAYENGVSFGYAQLALDFDRCFVDACENKTLGTIMDNMYDLLLLMVLYDHKKTASEILINFEEHEALLEAVKTGEHARVKQLLAHHFDKRDFFSTPENRITAK